MRKVFWAAMFLVVAGLEGFPQGADWPMEGRDPGRSSFFPVAVRPPLEVAWGVPLARPVEAVVAAGDTVVAVTSGRHEVVAMEIESGAERWRFRVPGVKGSFGSTPAISAGTVLVGGQLSDVLYALDLATGEVRWQREGFVNLYADPCIAGELAVVVSPAGLVALEAANGELRWRVTPRVLNSPAVAGGRVFVLAFGGELVAFALATGEEVWRARRAWSGSASDPLVVGDLVVLISGAEARFWDRETGGSRGRVTLPHVQSSGKPFTPAAAGDRLFVPVVNGETSWLVAVDTGAHRIGWTHIFPGVLRSPCVTGDVVYAAAGNLLLALDRESGELLWQRKFPGRAYTAPIAAGGAILCAFGDTLYKLMPAE